LDLDLVQRARGGDMQAFDEIVRSHVDPVYRITLGITGNEADARDASQDAFISAWRALPGLKEADRFDAWLTSIAVNASRMQLRRRRRVRELRLRPDDTATADELGRRGGL